MQHSGFLLKSEHFKSWKSSSMKRRCFASLPIFTGSMFWDDKIVKWEAQYLHHRTPQTPLLCGRCSNQVALAWTSSAHHMCRSAPNVSPPTFRKHPCTSMQGNYVQCVYVIGKYDILIYTSNMIYSTIKYD